MAEYKLTNKAVEDLSKIWDYTFEVWLEKQADIGALKFVFNKSKDTKGDIGISAVFSLTYTLLYVGWIFGIVYLTEIMK